MHPAEVTTVQHGPAHAAVCSVHGVLSFWTTPGLAAWNAVGHATTYHHG